MEIFLQFEPNPPRTTAQEKKIAVKYDGTPIVYDSERLVKARRAFLAKLTPFQPAAPLLGPIRLQIDWFFTTPNYQDDGWKTSRPDTDNLVKLLKDCLTKLNFWQDDAQVCLELCSKFQFKEGPHGVRITIEEL